jgi:hypothetical protein
MEAGSPAIASSGRPPLPVLAGFRLSQPWAAMLACMVASDLLDQLDERAATLEGLLDRHPGRHLLAEYEATVLECSVFSPAQAADLLIRLEHVIASLSATLFSEQGADHRS